MTKGKTTHKHHRTSPCTIESVLWLIIKVLIYVFMVFCAGTFLFGFVWILINSFKTAPDYMANVFGLPAEWDFDNFRQVLTNLSYKGHSLFAMLKNSLILVAFSVINTMIWPQFAGYAMARFQFPGRKLLEMLVYATMVIPVIGTASSLIQVQTVLGIYDTFFAQWLFGTAGLGFTQILLMTFYRGLPSAYAEAAYIDGAGEWRVFLSIYYPQSKPLLLIQIIQGIIVTWNDYMGPYLMLPSHPTLAIGLQQMQAQFVDFGNDYPVMFAGIILAILPILIIYLIFSDKIMNNMALGALK